VTQERHDFSPAGPVADAQCDAEEAAQKLGYTYPEKPIEHADLDLVGHEVYDRAFADSFRKLCSPGRVTAVWREHHYPHTWRFAEHDSGVLERLVEDWQFPEDYPAGERFLGVNGLEVELDGLVRHEGSPAMRAPAEISRRLNHACAPQSLVFDSVGDLWLAQCLAVEDQAGDGPCRGAWDRVITGEGPEPHTLVWRTETGRARFEVSASAFRAGLYSPAYGNGEVPYLSIALVERERPDESSARGTSLQWEVELHVTADTFRLAAGRLERLAPLWDYLIPVLGKIVAKEGQTAEAAVLAVAPSWSFEWLRLLAVADEMRRELVANEPEGEACVAWWASLKECETTARRIATEAAKAEYLRLASA
jgi:hypothetical protein